MVETNAEIAALSFEDALRALEDVVRRLESGEVPLDESISLYERGEALRAHCQARLDAAQARIEKIVAGPDGRASATVPFDPD
ncbi:exodeoxyribonuclease VII small subunit [Alteraurantiacibacter buctensis]|uniref:Exodeoxyribonuclease 7 small subunit n=1 Tax=Alteraurantiacibacter buctensis TaxID=1503981 RepID=A0A844YX21_9SPHN|nr:exodeoxyribonuclease VII small subunit [Alteraurantiacibacter buctensis]MXO71692.1 exodeoxyribonuclease VII small subunit [Alteraurantiacibacter buctensis]